MWPDWLNVAGLVRTGCPLSSHCSTALPSTVPLVHGLDLKTVNLVMSAVTRVTVVPYMLAGDDGCT